MLAHIRVNLPTSSVEISIRRVGVGEDLLGAGLGSVRETSPDARRFDQDDLNTEGRKLEAQGIAQSLQDELGAE